MAYLHTEILTISITFFVAASAFVGLYLISCILIVRKMGLADWLMLSAWVLDFGFSFSLLYAVRNGLGTHEVDINPDKEATLTRAFYTVNVLYNPTAMAVRSSILVFFLGLTKVRRLFYSATYVTLFVVNAVGLGLTFSQIFPCHPVGAIFHFKTQTEANCTNPIAGCLSSVPYDIATDLAILMLPVPLLTRLRIPWEQKLILIITFSAGFSVIIIDVVRIVQLQNAALEQLQPLGSFDITDMGVQDFTWISVPSYICSCVDINMTIICACVPSLKPLAGRFAPRLIGATRKPPGHASSLALSDGDRNIPSTAGRGRSTESCQNESDMMTVLTGQVGRGPERVVSALESSARRIPFITILTMRKKSMLRLSNKQSAGPIILVTVNFLLWAGSYSFLNAINSKFQKMAELSDWSFIGLHGAFYGGYTLGPLLVGRMAMKRLGISATLIAGLYIYAFGSLLFWPATVSSSFPMFILSNLIVGLGMAVLTTVSDMFVALCGPREYSEIRLSLSKAAGDCGLIFSRLLQSAVFGHSNIHYFIAVQWTCLCIAFFNVALAVSFHYLPLPSAHDEDLDELNSQGIDIKVFRRPIFWLNVVLGMWSQFWYQSAQEAINTKFTAYITASHASHIDPSGYLYIGQTLFVFSRFSMSFVQFFVKPRQVLLALYTGAIIFSILCMNTSGSTAAAMALVLHFCEGGIHPINFAISLRGSGRHAKTAACLLETCNTGAALLPFAKNAIVLTSGQRYSYCIVTAAFSAGVIYPLYLNLFPAARKHVDPVWPKSQKGLTS